MGSISNTLKSGGTAVKNVSTTKANGKISEKSMDGYLGEMKDMAQQQMRFSMAAGQLQQQKDMNDAVAKTIGSSGETGKSIVK